MKTNGCHLFLKYKMVQFIKIKSYTYYKFIQVF